MSPRPPGEVIPEVERLVEIGDKSIEPIRDLLNRIDEALWNDVPQRVSWSKVDERKRISTYPTGTGGHPQ